MMIATERLEQLAAEYERKAAALRLALLEVNGVAVKEAALPDDRERRRIAIRTYLAAHPWTNSEAIRKDLQQQGITISQDRVRQLLREMSNADEVMRRGQSTQTRYCLRSLDEHPNPSPAEKVR